MKDSSRWLRTYLGITGALAFLNLGIVAQIKGNTELSRAAIVFTLVFATLSVFNGLILFFAAWQAPRLLAKGPKFIKFAILLNFALRLVQLAPSTIAGDQRFLCLSLILVWSGMSFYMVKTTDRLAAQAKAGDLTGR